VSVILTTILNDAREYIFPLFTVQAGEGNGIFLESRVLLGTAFFVTKNGDAITARHVMPQAEDLPSDKRVVAIVQSGEHQQICLINQVATFSGCDLALIHVNVEGTKYLQLMEEDVLNGTDVQLVGVPSHEVWMSGKEMRILKGHVTLVSKQLELNIGIPPGMSGSPVFVGDKVAAFATASYRSEEIEDYSEEIETISNTREQMRITKVTRVTHYGMAYPFSALRGQSSPIFSDKTLMQLIAERNA